MTCDTHLALDTMTCHTHTHTHLAYCVPTTCRGFQWCNARKWVMPSHVTHTVCSWLQCVVSCSDLCGVVWCSVFRCFAALINRSLTQWVFHVFDTMGLSCLWHNGSLMCLTQWVFDVFDTMGLWCVWHNFFNGHNSFMCDMAHLKRTSIQNIFSGALLRCLSSFCIHEHIHCCLCCCSVLQCVAVCCVNMLHPPTHLRWIPSLHLVFVCCNAIQ